MLNTHTPLPIALFLCFRSIGLSQSPVPSVTRPPQAPPPTASGPGTPTAFHSDLLDLTFSYPPSLTAQTLPSLKEQHDEIAAKEPPNASEESRKTDECSDKALLALRQDDPAKLPAANQPGAATRTQPHPVTAKITISRIGVDCMPAKYKDHLDELAAAMSAALAQDRDLVPVDKPIWYEIDKTRVHFAAGETPSAPGQPAATPDPKSRWVASAAILWNGNLVSIVIESNDVAFFNEMLHSKIALGKSPGAPLFPADIGKGKQIEIKQ